MSSPASDALVESWALSLHGKRARTVRLYLDEAHRFVAWLEEHGRPESAPGDLAVVGRRDVEAWLSDLGAAGLAAATIRSRWIALRSLYAWAHDEEEVAENPLARVKVDEAAPAPVPVLTDDQLRALLAACQGTGFYEGRDAALIRLMAATGMRLTWWGRGARRRKPGHSTSVMALGPMAREFSEWGAAAQEGCPAAENRAIHGGLPRGGRGCGVRRVGERSSSGYRY